ncbi:MAG: NUDIX hydrolase [Patescibacteria group bacterium]|nr:NUDIX hydrolase [Patescibacteria group bacterium]
MEKGLIVHAAILNNDELLILKRAPGTYLEKLWDIPGGTLEDGEEPEEGTIREVMEETGLNLSKAAIFYCHSNVDQKKNKQFVTLIFLGKTDQKEIKINPSEHNEYAWVKLAEIKKYETVDYLLSCIEYLAEKKSGLSSLIS